MARAAPEEILTQWMERLAATTAQFPLEKIKLGLFVLILVWVVNNLVGLMWLLLPSPEAGIAQSTAKTSQKISREPSQTVDIKRLQDWNLFGEANAVNKPVEKVEAVVTPLDGIEDKAVTTRLQLVLQGVVAASDPGNSRAMIEHKNAQELYKIGDKLPVGNRVELAKILSDRVILDNGGRYESLLLYDENAVPRPSYQTPVAAAAGDGPVVDRRNDAEITNMATEYRKQLLTNPTSLAEVIKVSVAKDNEGNVIGYRVRPGRDRRQFSEFGFKAGDIVTQINGIELNNPTKALEIYRLMRTAQEATFEVTRGTEQMTFMVSLGEPGNGEVPGSADTPAD